MLKAALDIEKKYPQKVKLIIAESIPFKQYKELMNGCDVILDQLYSYTPAMNALLAMSKGIICIGGGEEENYKILDEQFIRPIINVEPNYQSVYKQLEKLISLSDKHINKLKIQSIQYVNKHHEYTKVAKSYENFYLNLLANK